jgi:hypothetical protein
LNAKRVGLFFFEVGTIFFVLCADVLQNIAIRNQHFSRLYGKRFGVHFGIVDGQLQIHMAEITPVEAFPNLQILALRVSRCIQPALVVEAFPVCVPTRIKIKIPSCYLQKGT